MNQEQRLENPTRVLTESQRVIDSLVRGQPAAWADHDPRPCPIPPDWSKGYPSLYEQQSGM